MKEYISVRRQLDGILGSRAKVAVLRVLHDGGLRLNGREVARKAGLTARSAHLALGSLAELGVVNMEAVGNNHVFSLNKALRLLSPSLSAVFEAEKAAPAALAREVVGLLRGETVLTVAWFGSVARGERSSASDMDVVVVLKDARAAGAARRRLEEHGPAFRRRFGLHVAPYVLGAKDLARKFDAGDPLAVNIVKDAVLLHGKPLAEVLSDAP